MPAIPWLQHQIRESGRPISSSAFPAEKKQQLLLKEHTLIWGAQQPSWIGALDSAQQRQEIEEWYAALADRYDSIEYIGVVNEPIHNAPNGMVPWGTTVPNVNYAGALGGAGVTGTTTITITEPLSASE